ncbi:hypothetical protein KA021_00230 [Candidatus Saccharibacteria bacterium]|nr:hypothetical protein [Candidatus Saccharibacteria bacterium]
MDVSILKRKECILKDKERLVQIGSWVLGGAVVVLAFTVWIQQRFGGVSLTVYDFFPLLGLSAFSLMWTHYIIGSTRRLTEVKKTVNTLYLNVTGWLVLVLILLHPLLLVTQLRQDGFGLPPGSYAARYGGPGMKLAILLGTISLVIFLAFELKQKLKNKTVLKVLEYGQILAMFLILYHGLTLGRELSVDWFKGVWYVYGLLLVFSVAYNFMFDHSPKKNISMHKK